MTDSTHLPRRGERALHRRETAAAAAAAAAARDGRRRVFVFVRLSVRSLADSPADSLQKGLSTEFVV